MAPEAFTFANSPFGPVAIGFFGLGTGYFIWGGQALFGYPKAGPKSIAPWACGVSGGPALPIPHGVNLMVGLTWFNVFGNAAPLYMAGVAFIVYGIHWFAMTHRAKAQEEEPPGFWELAVLLR
jgi:hypothetical protein